MNVCMNDMLYALSRALDAVEHDLVGASDYHAQRVAYMSIKTGYLLGMDENDLSDLGACAVLHDNALTEYLQSGERSAAEGSRAENQNLALHCMMGEENISQMPFYCSSRVKGAVLYHHERADGKGPFGKSSRQTPVYAQIIHLWDNVDTVFDFGNYREGSRERVQKYLSRNAGTLFAEELVKEALEVVTDELLMMIEGRKVAEILLNCLPRIQREYSPEDLMNLSDIFAKIIDYKSNFTSRHSLGIAQKARQMGEYYGEDEETAAKLYLAGALHDIGKLVVNTDILEKPGKLTPEEYNHIQDHAAATYEILKPIKGLEQITSWASHHHEKLDGSGYPFGRTAEELSHKERLLACLDIYQALTEARPYKEGMEHGKAMEILKKLGAEGRLDECIIQDIDHYYARYAG